MPHARYTVRVSVDGVPIPDANVCKGALAGHHCTFYVRVAADAKQRGPDEVKRVDLEVTCPDPDVLSFFQPVWYRTPSMDAVSPSSGPPGTLSFTTALSG